MENEIWKSIDGFKTYEVSNYGRVKSLSKKCKVNNGFRKTKEKIIKPFITTTGYYCLTLKNNNNIYKKIKVHQLVAIAFLGHIRCGLKLVVNHKDFDRLNNNVDNLEIVTARENANKKHIKSSSNYVGVCWSNDRNKWQAQIQINGKRKMLGRFINEIDAHNAYQEALNNITL